MGRYIHGAKTWIDCFKILLLVYTYNWSKVYMYVILQQQPKDRATIQPRVTCCFFKNESFARCTSVLNFHIKKLQITSKLLSQDYKYHKILKTFGIFQTLPLTFIKTCKNNLQPGISWWSDYKLIMIRVSNNFISSERTKGRRIWRRQYDPGTYLVNLQPCAEFSWSIVLWLTRRWGQHAGPCPNLHRGDKVPSFVHWLLFGTPKTTGP